MGQAIHTRLLVRVAPAIVVVLVATASYGCKGAANVAGPSPSPVSVVRPRIVALVVTGGVVLKAEHLEGAQQVEGILEWAPKTLWYQSFDLGQWWFSSTDWEWTIVPSEGRALWGVWRDERATGDGVLGVIRFAGDPSIETLRVWVDGAPVDAVMEGRGARGWSVEGVTTGSGLLQGAQGARAEHRWFLDGMNR